MCLTGQNGLVYPQSCWFDWTDTDVSRDLISNYNQTDPQLEKVQKLKCQSIKRMYTVKSLENKTFKISLQKTTQVTPCTSSILQFCMCVQAKLRFNRWVVFHFLQAVTQHQCKLNWWSTARYREVAVTHSSRAALPLLQARRRRAKERGGNEGPVSHKRPVSKEKANLGTSELQWPNSAS